MVKLQAYIYRSRNGYENLVNINPSEDVRRHICDFRPAIEPIVYDAGVRNVFYLASVVEGGLLFTVLSTLPGVKDDHVATSIFVPDGAKISLDEWRGILGTVESATASDKISEKDLSALRAIFSREYTAAVNPPRRVPAAGRKFAYTFFDAPSSPSFADFFARGFYRPEYAAYSGVVLVDGNTGAVPTVRNITQATLPVLVALNPPAHTPQGFEPYIYHCRFTGPFLVPENEEVELLWRRQGFESISQRILITGKDQKIDLPDTSQARKVVSPGTFFVTAQGTQRSLGRFTVKINGTEIDGPVPFRHRDLHHAKVEITSPGYFDFTGDFDLTSVSRVPVHMKPLHKTYRFELPLHTPEPVEAVRVYINTKKPLSRCPIEGYSVIGDSILEGAGVSNKLVYIGGRGHHRVMRMLASGVIGIIVGVIIGFFAFHAGNATPAAEEPELIEALEEIGDTARTATEAPVQQQAEAQVQAPDVPRQPDARAVASYLDSHKVWRQSDLVGLNAGALFEDLNTYNFARIKSYWAPMLGDSKNFKTLLKAMQNGAGKRDPRTAPHEPTYNKKGDEAISWLAYTYWIDP